MDRVKVGRATTDGMVVDTRKGNAGVGMVSMGISAVRPGVRVCTV